eukprot:2053754-Amphidinium_carterae.1
MKPTGSLVRGTAEELLSCSAQERRKEARLEATFTIKAPSQGIPRGGRRQSAHPVNRQHLHRPR